MKLKARELALYAAKKMLDKGAENVKVLSVVESGCLFDYVVLGNGRSDRQTTTLVQEVYHFCKRNKVSHGKLEGNGGGWSLMDCYDVVVHSFTEEWREYYDLDSLWNNSTIIDHEKETEKLSTDID